MAALPPESQAPPALVAHYKLQFTKAFYFVVLDTQKPFQPVNGQNPLIFNLTLIVKCLQEHVSDVQWFLLFYYDTPNADTSILWHLDITTNYSLAETLTQIHLYWLK